MNSSIKKIMKSVMFRIISGYREFSDLKVLSGPAKGTKLRLDIRKEASYWLGNYDQWIFENVPFSQLVKSGNVVWDCGAYVGYYAAVCRKVVGEKGRVYVFEASTKNFSRLKYLPEINNWKNVEVLNMAVGPDHSTIQFVNNIDGSNGPFNLGKFYKEAEVDLDIENVICCGVDELVYEKGIEAPDFIKFDLESAEEFALHNGKRVFTEKRPVVLLELHGERPRDAAGLFLEKYNYVAYLLTDCITKVNPIKTLSSLGGLSSVPHQILCLPV